MIQLSLNSYAPEIELYPSPYFTVPMLPWKSVEKLVKQLNNDNYVSHKYQQLQLSSNAPF